MPYYPINETTAKEIITSKWGKILPTTLYIKTVSLQANINTTLVELNIFNTDSLVLKPDQLFGKRFKNGLVYLGLSKQEVITKIKDLGKKETILLSGHSGILDNFIVETLVPKNEHTKIEHYLFISMEKEGDRISYSRSGGVDIESNLGSLKQVLVPNLRTSNSNLREIISKFSLDQMVLEFIEQVYTIFVDNSFMELELNPFVIDGTDVYLLDCVAKLDRYEVNLNSNLVFKTHSFGTKILTTEEVRIAEIDEASPASLKFSLLNPNGRIWGLYSGGGASMALFDTLGSKCDFKQVANYGEYSGNPTFDEVYAYTNQVLSLISKTTHSLPNILLIGGGTANFTDVKATLEGIAKALSDNLFKIDLSTIRVLLRRGGPNCEAGIKIVKQTCEDFGIYFVGYGPLEPLCKIIDEVALELNKN
jgi:ATP-citrate lyase beta-subunit